MKGKRFISIVAILVIVATFLSVGLVGCKKAVDEPPVVINEVGADAFIKWMSLKSTQTLIADYGVEDYNSALFLLNDDRQTLDITATSLKFEGSGAKTNVIRISTTTSVNDTGLLPYLQKEFEELGWKMEVQSAGTGAAIQAARDGNADMILVHSKKAEEEFVGEGYTRRVLGFEADRIPFMHNYFVVVGPTADPAGITNSTDAKEAFAAIAALGGKDKFISRGDKSGTYNKEVTLWADALGLNKSNPEEQTAHEWYSSIGQGMGVTLTTANEKEAYTLSDNGTFLRYKNDKKGDTIPKLTDMNVLGGDLKNTYSMLAVSQLKFDK